MSSSFDYIIVGGGNAGCVIASRLSHSGFKVALFETGPVNYTEAIMDPLGASRLHYTAAEYNYYSTPQPEFNDRKIPNHGGRILSGSSGVNYGLWTRGHSADYNYWAYQVGGSRWRYDNLLKYFKKTETFYDHKAGSDIHGFDGPIYLESGQRPYPLKADVLEALKESGLKFNPDGNSGNPLGIANFTEAWKNHQRQPAGLAYDLSKVNVFTESTVSRLNIDDSKTATGVTLSNGTIFTAKKEVIVSSGAVKTPQLLMLSGIGPTEELKAFDIPQIVDLPVGQNLHDHISAGIFWKLKNPEQGLSLGSASFKNPALFTGNPIDWITTLHFEDDKLAAAAQKDGITIKELFGDEPRSHAEFFVAYAPLASGGSGYTLPFDGTHIATTVILLLPTARGTLTLASKNIEDDPIVDPRYLGSEVDKAVLREGLRAALRSMETGKAKEFVVGETPPAGFAGLTSICSDDELDTRIKHIGASFYQNAGTAAMGKVVDTDLKVKGTKNLRVCDASILTGPIASHYQAAIYAIAEAGADIIKADA